MTLQTTKVFIFLRTNDKNEIAGKFPRCLIIDNLTVAAVRSTIPLRWTHANTKILILVRTNDKNGAPVNHQNRQVRWHAEARESSFAKRYENNHKWTKCTIATHHSQRNRQYWQGKWMNVQFPSQLYVCMILLAVHLVFPLIFFFHFQLVISFLERLDPPILGKIFELAGFAFWKKTDLGPKWSEINHFESKSNRKSNILQNSYPKQALCQFRKNYIFARSLSKSNVLNHELIQNYHSLKTELGLGIVVIASSGGAPPASTSAPTRPGQPGTPCSFRHA